MFRHAMSVSFPRSISADEAVFATTGDVSEYVKAADRLQMRRRWRCFSLKSELWKAPRSTYNVQNDKNNEHCCGSTQYMYSVADRDIHILWRHLEIYFQMTMVVSVEPGLALQPIKSISQMRGVWPIALHNTRCSHAETCVQIIAASAYVSLLPIAPYNRMLRTLSLHAFPTVGLSADCMYVPKQCQRLCLVVAAAYRSHNLFSSYSRLHSRPQLFQSAFVVIVDFLPRDAMLARY